jgi:hypothetical protein
MDQVSATGGDRSVVIRVPRVEERDRVEQLLREAWGSTREISGAFGLSTGDRLGGEIHAGSVVEADVVDAASKPAARPITPRLASRPAAT